AYGQNLGVPTNTRNANPVVRRGANRTCNVGTVIARFITWVTTRIVRVVVPTVAIRRHAWITDEVIAFNDAVHEVLVRGTPAAHLVDDDARVDYRNDNAFRACRDIPRLGHVDGAVIPEIPG